MDVLFKHKPLKPVPIMLLHYSNRSFSFFREGYKDTIYISPPRGNHPKLRVNIWSSLDNDPDDRLQVYIADSSDTSSPWYHEYYYLLDLAPGEFIQIPTRSYIKIETKKVSTKDQSVCYAFISTNPFI